MSAGSKPTGQVHPPSLALQAKDGISTEGCYSKSWHNFAASRIVITVSANAAGKSLKSEMDRNGTLSP
jgi:arsenate reductase (thioredoxin)